MQALFPIPSHQAVDMCRGAHDSSASVEALMLIDIPGVS